MLFDLVLEDFNKANWKYGVSARIRNELENIVCDKEHKYRFLIFETDPFLIFRKNNGSKTKLEDLNSSIDQIKKTLIKKGIVPISALPRKYS